MTAALVAPTIQPYLDALLRLTLHSELTRVLPVKKERDLINT